MCNLSWQDDSFAVCQTKEHEVYNFFLAYLSNVPLALEASLLIPKYLILVASLKASIEVLFAPQNLQNTHESHQI